MMSRAQVVLNSKFSDAAFYEILGQSDLSLVRVHPIGMKLWVGKVRGEEYP